MSGEPVNFQFGLNTTKPRNCNAKVWRSCNKSIPIDDYMVKIETKVEVEDARGNYLKYDTTSFVCIPCFDAFCSRVNNSTLCYIKNTIPTKEEPTS